MATARMPSNCGSDLLNATPGKSGTAPQAGSGQRGGLHPFTRPVVQILAQERHLLGQYPGAVLEAAYLPAEPDADGEEEQLGHHGEQVGRVLHADAMGNGVEQAREDGEHGDDDGDGQPHDRVLLVQVPPSRELYDGAERDDRAGQGDDMDSGHGSSVVGALVDWEWRRNTDSARNTTTRRR